MRPQWKQTDETSEEIETCANAHGILSAHSVLEFKMLICKSKQQKWVDTQIKFFSQH